MGRNTVQAASIEAVLFLAKVARIHTRYKEKSLPGILWAPAGQSTFNGSCSGRELAHDGRARQAWVTRRVRKPEGAAPSRPGQHRSKARVSPQVALPGHFSDGGRRDMCRTLTNGTL